MLNSGCLPEFPFAGRDFVRQAGHIGSFWLTKLPTKYGRASPQSQAQSTTAEFPGAGRLNDMTITRPKRFPMGALFDIPALGMMVLQ
jgi:hypothetical protein